MFNHLVKPSLCTMSRCGLKGPGVEHSSVSFQAVGLGTPLATTQLLRCRSEQEPSHSTRGHNVAWWPGAQMEIGAQEMEGYREVGGVSQRPGGSEAGVRRRMPQRLLK